MKKTLVIMAAGMGSRFGGLKQITPVDEFGNFIIDYSIYDACRCGIDKVVFVIKKENYEDFKNTIGKRIQDKIEVCYAFQELEDIPISLDLSKREKPWGTVQAILAAKDFVPGSFIVMNADDFYGKNAIMAASSFLDQAHENSYACISYPFFATQSFHGAVKRGVLKLNHDMVQDIMECSLECDGKNLIAQPLDGSQSFVTSMDTPVSMNLFAFTFDFFEKLEEYFQNFFEQDEEYILSHEVLLPSCLKENLRKHTITLKNIPSNSKWLGMTYQSDLAGVKEELKKLREEGEYPLHLWEES